MEAFLARVVEVLDLEGVEPEQVLEDLPEWDSLTALSLIAMLDAKYGVNLAASDLKGGLTAAALFKKVQDWPRR